MLSRFRSNAPTHKLIHRSDVVLRYLGPSDARDYAPHLHELHYERISVTVSISAWSPIRGSTSTVAHSANEATSSAPMRRSSGGGSRNCTPAWQIPEHGSPNRALLSVASDWRRRGSHHLLRRCLRAEVGKRNLHHHCPKQGHRTNAMKALARKFGARMQFASEQSVGRINVAEGSGLAARDRCAQAFSPPCRCPSRRCALRATVELRD